MKTVKKISVIIAFLKICAIQAQLNVRATVSHIQFGNGLSQSGNILLNSSGGTSTYLYTWYQGMNPYESDRLNVSSGLYDVKVNSGNDSIVRKYEVGYKANWSILNGIIASGDNLLIDAAAGSVRTALSANTLRPLTDGWAEYVIGDLVNPYLVGFAYNATSESKDKIDDIEFAFYLNADNILYCWELGKLTFLDHIEQGDVIRIERRENYYVLIKNAVVLREKETEYSKELKLKVQIDSDILMNIGCNFVDYTSESALKSRIKVEHISMDGTVPGKIEANGIEGSSPYTYMWADGISSNVIISQNPSTNNLTITDYALNSITGSYNIGYKTEWADFRASFVRNDSLVPTPDSDGSSSAISINTLKQNTNGWAELVTAPYTSAYSIGFSDDVSINNGNITDLDVAFHINDNNLYAWDGNYFALLTSVKTNDVIKIGRNNSGFYITINNDLKFTQSSATTNELRLKALITNGIPINIGCNFTLPLEVDYVKSNISSPEEPTSGSIFLKPKYGRPPYQFSWSNGSTENSLTEIGNGVYNVTVTDSLLDEVKYSFTLGDRAKFVNLKNIYRHNENGFIKNEIDLPGFANMNTYIPAEQNGSYEFLLEDVNTNFNFVLNPFDGEGGFITQTPVKVRETVVSILRSQLPAPVTPEYSKINFADNITTGDYANIIQKEFIGTDCETCERVEVSGIHYNYGKIYTLINGVTIKKGEDVENNSTIRLDLIDNNLNIFKNENSIYSGTLDNGIDLIGSISLLGSDVQMSLGAGGSRLTPNGPPVLLNNNTTPSSSEGCGACSNDLYKNYSEIVFFDELGGVIAQKRDYYDNLGRLLQSQAKDIATNSILASQVFYDAYGRVLASTLNAPTNNTCFCFKTDFVKNASNTAYTYNDFDRPNYTSNSTLLSWGEQDKPNPVASNFAGTLGWYYSNNNTIEKYVPTAETPYSKIEYSHVDPSSELRASKPGRKLNSGSGHETYNFKMNTMGELSHLFGSGNYWRIDELFDFYQPDQCISQIKPCPLMNTAPLSMKSISRDENGNETVTFMDLSGNIIATCLSGKVNGANVKTQMVSGWLSFIDETQRYIDVHVPEGCENSLTISNPVTCSNNPFLTNGVASYNILNLKTGRLVWFGGSINSYDFVGTQPNLPAGYYRIMVKNRPWCVSGVSVVQKLNYYNFSLYYYDYANRLKAVVSPKGFDNAFVLNNSQNNYSANKTIKVIVTNENEIPNFPEGKSWSLNESVFESQMSLALPVIGSDSSSIMNINVTFDNKFALAPGEDPEAMSPEQISGRSTTSFADYTRLTHISDVSGFESEAPDPLFYNSETIAFKLKIALTDGENNIVDNTTRDAFIKCEIQKRGDQQRIVWEPISFNYNFQLTNNTGGNTSYPVKKLKILELEPVELDFGDHFSQYEELTAALKISNGITLLNTKGLPNHKMVERFRYNSWGELEAKVSPDEGLTEYVYNKNGNLKFIQNAKQDASTSNRYFRKFSYVDYDEMDRSVTSGEFTPPVSGISTQGVGTTINKYLYFESYQEQDMYAPLSNYISVHDRTEVAFTKISYLHNGPMVDFNSTDKSYVSYDSFDPQFWTETNLSPNVYTQRHLIDRISFTYNQNKKTWYSYDEQGRLEWCVQKYYGVNAPGPGADIVKTFQYKYDYLGNLIEKIYNTENSIDRLHHYFEYDQNKRLKRVYTSRPSGSAPVTYPKLLQAKYDYYLHGPLKRVEIGDNLQGIDYVYTINGWLKTMNSPEMEQKRDPGEDGYMKPGDLNTAYKDLFGFALEYFYEDYQRAGTYIQSYLDAQNTTAFAPDLFNGIIKAHRWQTKTPSVYTGIAYQNQQLMFGYQYDKKYQLKEANFGAIYQNGGQNEPTLGNIAILGSTALQDYKVSGITYDYNGNILSLKRNAYAASGINLDDLTYNYYTCSNKLSSVSDAVATNPYNNLGFKPGQSNTNYAYYLTGEMATDASNSKIYEYNSLGNITAIKTPANNLVAEYSYDEAGYRIKKIAHLPGGNKKYTLYIRDASGQIITTFEKTSTSNNTNFGLPAEWNIYGGNRLGIIDNTGGTERYIYELNDHLGNTRVTFKKSNKISITNNFNSNATTNDDNWFKNIYNNVFNSFDINSNPVPTNYFTRTQKTLNKAYGAGTKRIPVKNGDNITLSWKSLFESGIAPVAGMVLTLVDEAGNQLPLFTAYQYIGIPGSNSANTWNTQQTTINITGNYPKMYLVFYPWNNDNNGGIAFFDDISITFNIGKIFEPEVLNMADYYPHGSVMPGMNYNTSYKYKYGYQGQFAEMDEETNENFFELRNYDPLLARFNSPDPYGQYWSPYMAMGNSHPNGVDPDGGFSTEGAVIGAGVGMVAGAAAYGIIEERNGGKERNYGVMAAYIIGGGILGALGGGYGGDIINYSGNMFTYTERVVKTVEPVVTNTTDFLWASRGILTEEYAHMIRTMGGSGIGGTLVFDALYNKDQLIIRDVYKKILYDSGNPGFRDNFTFDIPQDKHIIIDIISGDPHLKTSPPGHIPSRYTLSKTNLSQKIHTSTTKLLWGFIPFSVTNTTSYTNLRKGAKNPGVGPVRITKRMKFR